MCNLLRLLKIPMVSSLLRVLAPYAGALLSCVLYINLNHVLIKLLERTRYGMARYRRHF